MLVINSREIRVSKLVGGVRIPWSSVASVTLESRPTLVYDVAQLVISDGDRSIWVAEHAPELDKLLPMLREKLGVETEGLKTKMGGLDSSESEVLYAV